MAGVAILDSAGYNLTGSTLRLRGGVQSPDQVFETPAASGPGRKRKIVADESPCEIKEKLNTCFSGIDTNILECRAVIEERVRVFQMRQYLAGPNSSLSGRNIYRQQKGCNRDRRSYRIDSLLKRRSPRGSYHQR
ncbi:unnamed protein product [Macrosiphum euphorbiae]|uniref:Uncharacterized protein n=1 Tax=Macrosiphum euphorbiae TaxID=13131 RepID=A0AAV0XW21_9HEMI|nr:unnamed protein product [Macrosiphum euphorbiae]